MPDKESPVKIEAKKEEKKIEQKQEQKIEVKKDDFKKSESRKEEAKKIETKLEIKKEADKSTEAETQKILEMSEISIWLDDYDDIFSVFDPRPFSKRSLSDDFLSEAKKASREKLDDKLELRLLLPEAKRDAREDAIVKKRLREHFNKHARMLKDEIQNSRKRGFYMFLLGIVLIMTATSIDSFLEGGFWPHLFFVMLEPSGWFVTWYALDSIFYPAQAKKTELDFYRKMSKCEIIVSSY